MIFFLGLIFQQYAQPSERWTVKSPNGLISITLELADQGSEADYPSGKKRLYYKVEYGSEAQKKEIIQYSPLGIIRQDANFVDNLVFNAISEKKLIDEFYTLPHGKRHIYHNYARELTVGFTNPDGARLEIILRAYDDGVAFKYRFPETSYKNYTVIEEITGFRIPENSLAYIQPHDSASKYTPAYEAYHIMEMPVGQSSPKKAGWSFPALFKIDNGNYWALISEAGLDGSYCGCRLAQKAPAGVYRIRFPDEAEGNGTGQVCPHSTLPWETPWRVIILGKNLGTIVESSLVTHLNPPSQVEDTRWIKPGRVSWSWWSKSDSPKNFDDLCEFIDLAAEMGWEYSLIDANWNKMGNATIRKLARYAQNKGIGLLFWYNSGGKHNVVTEEPRDRMSNKDVRRKEFQFLREIGVKGVKVDFFQSDKQNIIQHYINILKDAADFQMMVNFHGCTIPRGWSRTYPHLMTMEGVKGAENYKYDKTFPERAPAHNTMLVFTRNVVGPMDYTPVTFSDHKYPHLTTYGHELALSVVFESGWVHFADAADSYRKLPGEVKKFLQDVPADWDDIHFIDGEPGHFVALARRKGDNWYVGAINGQIAEQKVQIDFSFLDEGKYIMKYIGDGKSDRSFQVQKAIIAPSHWQKFVMRPRGGFVIQLMPF